MGVWLTSAGSVAKLSWEDGWMQLGGWLTSAGMMANQLGGWLTSAGKVTGIKEPFCYNWGISTYVYTPYRDKTTMSAKKQNKCSLDVLRPMVRTPCPERAFISRCGPTFQPSIIKHTNVLIPVKRVANRVCSPSLLTECAQLCWHSSSIWFDSLLICSINQHLAERASVLCLGGERKAEKYARRFCTLFSYGWSNANPEWPPI